MIKINLFINIFIIIINFYFKYFRREINFSFKNTDKITIDFIKSSYNNISNILNSKYLVNNNKTENIKKKKISLFFVDCNPSFYTKPQYKILIDILKRKYELEIKPDNPDYLIFNVHGCKHIDKKYERSIKIAFFTENQIPDLNIIDYAIGQSHILFLDRYFKSQYFFGLLFDFNNRYLKLIRNKVLNSYKRTKFCSAVISNSYWTDYFRLEFIEELNMLNYELIHLLFIDKNIFIF